MKKLAFSLFLTLGTSAPAIAAEETFPTLSLGAGAPEFNLPGGDGRTYSLKDFKAAKVLTIIFTCNHCPTAQYYEERIKQLVRDYQNKGVAFIAISPNDPKAVRPDELGYTDLSDTPEEMKIRARDHHFNFPYLYGGGEHEPTSRAYGPVATPHAFVFDGERKLRYAGRIDDSEREKFVRVRDVRNALDALLAGREVEVKQTRVFGCSVKWSNKGEGVEAYWKKIAAEPVTVESVNAEGLRAIRINEAAKNDRAKLRLVNFWATWCGPCVTEFPDLMLINRMYRQRDFEIVTVAAHYPDEKEDALKFLKKQQASNRNLIFGETDKYKMIEAFDPKWDGALPYTLLIDPAGEVLYRKQGPFDALELKRTIVKALNARKPW
ncbi:MAG: redoxin domain-containing protein [Verrucomicrobia bacterium]|nr:redoxin domain-containing protein [Verrucomicrobiota bacterium]